MVIEASVVAGYVIAWAVTKARRAVGRLDAEVDSVIDAGMDRLHETVAGKLGTDPVLQDVEEEAAGEQGRVSELTRQRVELAVMAAARKDDGFGQAVTDLVGQLRVAEQRGAQVLAGGQSTVLTGDARAEARDGGIAFGQVGRDVNVDRGGERGPTQPGR